MEIRCVIINGDAEILDSGIITPTPAMKVFNINETIDMREFLEEELER